MVLDASGDYRTNCIAKATRLLLGCDYVYEMIGSLSEFYEVGSRSE